MVVGCPKCKAKLKIPDEKIKPEGSKFKCPKCGTTLPVKRPVKKVAPPPPPPPSFEEPSPFDTPEPEAPPPPSFEEPSPFDTPEPEAPPPPSFEEPSPFDTPEPEAPPPPSFEEPSPFDTPEPEAPSPPWFEEPSPFDTPESEAPPLPSFEEPSPFEAPEPEAPAPPSFEAPEPEAPAPPSFEEPSPFEAPEPEAPAPPSFEEPPPFEAPAPPSFEEPPPFEAPVTEEPPTPPAEAPTPTSGRKVLLAHDNPEIVNMLKFVLSGANFSVINAPDGITTLMKALQEQPSVVVVDVRLPKIHGIEIMKRLSTRAETKDIKIILVGNKPESEVPPIKGAVGYIHEDRLQQGLVSLINNALESPAVAAEPAAEKKPAPVPKPAAPANAGAERAQRFCRTVLADIDLYNPDKVAESIRAGNFESVFAKEINEGRRLYEMRIPEEARAQGDFFTDAVRAFLEKKQKQLGL